MNIFLCTLLGLAVILIGSALAICVLGAFAVGFFYLLETYRIKIVFQSLLIAALSSLILFNAYHLGCAIHRYGWSVIWRAR
jgi:hypothetical protein